MARRTARLAEEQSLAAREIAGDILTGGRRSNGLDVGNHGVEFLRRQIEGRHAFCLHARVNHVTQFFARCGTNSSVLRQVGAAPGPCSVGAVADHALFGVDGEAGGSGVRRGGVEGLRFTGAIGSIAQRNQDRKRRGDNRLGRNRRLRGVTQCYPAG